MAHRDSFVVGLDLGSTKTCALVCHPGEKGKLRMAGFGMAESKGWRKSVIANLDLTVLAIKKAVESAEAAAGVSVGSAFVGVGGNHIKGINSQGSIALGKTPGGTRAVEQEDIVKVLQIARNITLPPDREIVYPEPKEYMLDSQDGIRNPVGMTGGRLEANIHLITGSSTALRNVVTAVNLAGIEVIDTVYEPFASITSCVTQDERELGIALVDIGGGSTDLIVYSQGSVRHTASIPVGGDHFTNDIAVGLRTTIPEAERIKRSWGDTTPDGAAGSVLEVPSVGERPARLVGYAMLREIIEPRAIELLELVQSELERSGHYKQLGAGLMMVGGGAKLGGLTALAEQILGLPVRIGKCAGLENMEDEFTSPEYAALVGLAVYGNRRRLIQDSKKGGLFSAFWDALRGKGNAS